MDNIGGCGGGEAIILLFQAVACCYGKGGLIKSDVTTFRGDP